MFVLAVLLLDAGFGQFQAPFPSYWNGEFSIWLLFLIPLELLQNFFPINVCIVILTLHNSDYNF